MNFFHVKKPLYCVQSVVRNPWKNSKKEPSYRYQFVVVQRETETETELQQIQVERLTVSVVAIVVTVDLIALRGKMTDIARRE